MLSNTEEGLNTCIDLSVKSKLMTEDRNAFALLGTLSLLPGGVSRQCLDDWWTPHIHNPTQAIGTLRKAALLATETKCTEVVSKAETIYSILPVVQSYMVGRIPAVVRIAVQDACCELLFANNSTPNHPDFTTHRAVLIGEETNIQSVLSTVTNDVSDPNRLLKVVRAMLSFCWHQNWTQPRLDVAEQTVALARRIASPVEPALLVECLICFGTLQLKLEYFTEASRTLEEARQCIIANKLDAPDAPEEWCRLDASCNQELGMAYIGEQKFYLVYEVLDRLREKLNRRVDDPFLLKAFGKLHI
jgi:hypothetical protein